MSLLQKLKKSSTIEQTDVLSASMFFSDQDIIPTDIPAMNVALSGQLHGGMTSGFTMFAGPSKHFKTAFTMIMAKAYMQQYDDAVMIFYDSEFGSPQSYFDSFDIPSDRVLHCPITDIEMLKHDIMTQLEQIKRGDKVIIVIDSIGNLASKKEIDDALEGKTVADMTRAKALKSLFRMVTPHLSIKDISLVAVNHTYKEIALYPKDIVGGGCVVEGTLIQTPDGLKAVEDFVLGDTVMTLEGPRNVTDVWTPETLDNGTPDCFEVVFEDGYRVVCSDKHKFLVGGSWVEAKNLRFGDDVSAV